VGADDLVRLTERVLGNPFATVERAEAEHALAAMVGQAPGLLDDLVSGGEAGRARRLAVALAYCDERRSRRSGLVDPGGLPARLLERMKLTQAALERVVQAGVGCTVALEQLAGVSPAIVELRAAVWRACFGDSLYQSMRMQPLLREQHLLVLAETGCGKELVAQAVAAAAPRGAPHEVVNAAALPADLIEGELFGYVKGAFTGAAADRQGRIAAADGGTLFLDEIADLAGSLQPKLLRVVETNEVSPLGSNRAQRVDVRYISATARPLEKMVDRGEFRRDLFQRLARVVIEIPPLRDRPEDIEPIASALFRRFTARIEEAGEVTASTSHLSRLALLEVRFHAWLGRSDAHKHSWPGNVRELENLVRSWVLGAGEASPSPAIATTTASGDQPSGPTLPDTEVARILDGQATLREVEDWYIRHVLARVNYSQRAAAKQLDIDRGTLARRLKS